MTDTCGKIWRTTFARNTFGILLNLYKLEKRSHSISSLLLTGGAFTYQIEGKNAIFLGLGDQHDPKYDYLRVDSPFDIGKDLPTDLLNEHWYVT